MPARTTRSSDKPAVHFSFSKFEDVDVEPFVYTTKANKRVTFPDLYAMEANEGETLLLRMKSGEISDGQLLAEWLPKGDLDALNADRLTVRRRMELIQRVFDYYEQKSGSLGEGNASES